MKKGGLVPVLECTREGPFGKGFAEPIPRPSVVLAARNSTAPSTRRRNARNDVSEHACLLALQHGVFSHVLEMVRVFEHAKWPVCATARSSCG